MTTKARQAQAPYDGPPIVLYFFAMLGCEYCEEAKKTIVPKLQEAGVYVQIIVDAFEAHEVCGFTPKVYPTWLLTMAGRKIATFQGLTAPKMILQAFDKIRSAA